MAGRLVSHRSVSDALSQVYGESLARGGALESGGAAEEAAAFSDAEVRAYLTDALAALESEERDAGVMATAQHQLASLLQSHLADNPDDIQVLEEEAAGGGLEVKFDKGDVLGWARSVLEWWRRIKPERWVDPPGTIDAVGDGTRLRMVVVGDWGTGLYGAPVIAETLRSEPEPFDLLVHLGDVYYSGTRKEVEDNFKRYWPKEAGKLSRALNSNHEMYSGGEGLFRVTMPWFEQPSTCWAAQNDHWLLVGLDSAYSDHDLVHDQAAWLTGLVREKGDRRVLLFCHHQPYSLLDKQGPKLVAKLGRLLDGGHVFGWYWGHEHRCVIYDPHPVWEVRGRCIGHGGYPAYRDKLDAYTQSGGCWRRLPARNLVPGGLVLDMRNEYIRDQPDRYGANGYVTLTMDGPSLVERVHQPDGKVLLEQKLA